MKKLTIIFFAAISIVYSQQVGQWKIYSDMTKISSVINGQSGVWAVTTGGAFKYGFSDNSYTTLTKANGLNSQVLTAVCRDNNGKIWFGSTEGYLNIFDEGTGDVGIIMDIYATGKSKRQINNLYVSGDTVFVSTDFGLSLINSANNSFYDSFLKFGTFPTELKVRSTFKSSLIYVVTDNGVAVQKPGTQNLSVPEAWNTFVLGQEISAESATKILAFNGQILLSTNNGIYRFVNNQWQQYLMPGTDVQDMFRVNNNLYFITNNTLQIYSNDQTTKLYENVNATFNALYVTTDQSIYIASNVGLIEYKNGTATLLHPNGPLANQFINMAVDDNGNLWIATGKDGNGVGIMQFDGDTWQYYDVGNTPELVSNDFINVSSRRNSVFFSNWGRGLTVYMDNKFTTYNADNTDLIGIPNDVTFLPISAAQEDSKGNIWLVNSFSAGRKQLSVLTTNNTWYHYSVGNLDPTDALGKMVIDQYDTKWFTVELGSPGLYYYNEKNTFGSLTDDSQGNLTQSDGLITSSIGALAIDKRGQLWIGTSEGMNLIQDPSRPKTTLSTAAFSVRNQSITCIAVDPLDQKWVGTKQGVFVLSSDGYQLINYYTTSNSPLPNDDIKSIAINPIDGVVYIGTDNGLAALATSSVQPVESFNELFVYPNPYVIDGSSTKITIDGLVKNTSIKILDINGSLIRSFVTPGGKVAFWDGKDDNGNYVSSGIYVIVAYDDEANNVTTAKVAVVRK